MSAINYADSTVAMTWTPFGKFFTTCMTNRLISNFCNDCSKMQQLRKEFQQAKTILQLMLERELLAEVTLNMFPLFHYLY